MTALEFYTLALPEFIVTVADPGVLPPFRTRRDIFLPSAIKKEWKNIGKWLCEKVH